jgi:hypothetical protein
VERSGEAERTKVETMPSAIDGVALDTATCKNGAPTPAAQSEEACRALVIEEIRSIVADAEKSESILSTGEHAKRLHATYPGAGFSVGRIADELIMEATRRKVALFIDRPK